MDTTVDLILSAVTSLLTGLVGFLVYKLKKREADKERSLQAILKREEAINEALRVLCSDRINQGYRYYKQNGGVSTQDLETMSNLYNAYHNLGDNGTNTIVFEKIKALPIKKVIKC